MVIHVHSRLYLAWYKGCTNARCILSRSYGHEEFKIVNPFLVQKAHKAVRAGQYLLPMQRLILPSMEIRVHSRPILARYKRCTNARCILPRNYGHEEFKNVNLLSVQKAHKAVRAGQYLRSLQRRRVPSMEIHVHSRLILVRYKGCTNARCILSRRYGHEEFKNVNPFLVQKAHKAVRAGQYLLPMQRLILPSMEIRVHSRPILARYKGCTNARCILPRNYGHEEFKNVNLLSVQKAHKAVRAGQYLRSLQRRRVPSMEIHVHSRLILVRYKGCTNARCILSRRYGHEEFKNVNPFLVQKAHKAVRAGQYLRPMQRRIVPSMEIRVHSRPILAQYKGCSNARCMLSRSYGHEQFKNVNPFSVQKAHKAVRDGQYLHPMQRRIVPSMEIRAHSRLVLSRYKGCTNARCILPRSFGHEEIKNVNLFSVQNAHKAVRAVQYLRSQQLRTVPSMEIHVHSQLFLAPYKCCTNARCILSRSYVHEEFGNTNIFSVQKAHKAVRAGKYLLSLQRRRVPSMEIYVHSRLFLARYKGCTNARCILSRSYGHEEFENVNIFSVQKAHKAERAGQYLRPMQRRIVPSMEIRAYSRPILARYKGCTNARCMLSRSYGHEEFKNVNPFSVQKAHKSVRAGQYLRPMQRRIVPSMEIRVHSRPILARYKGCINARCMLSRSYGHEEFKNVNPFTVQKAHKSVRAGQYLRPMQRRIVHSMEIRVHSRLILARYKGFTNARCILSRSYGHEEYKNVNPFSVQKAHKAQRAGQYLRSLQRRRVPSMEIHVHSQLFLVRYKCCTNARCILSRIYVHEEFGNVIIVSVQKAHKAVRSGQYLHPMQRRIVPSMEIRVHSRPILAQYKGCSNARCMLSRSYGHEQFKNVNPFSVQKAHKAVRAGQYLHPMQRRLVPSIEIRAHSRLVLSRYKGCTNARCILPRSFGHEEIKNVNLFSVQNAHKAVRAGQYLRSQQLRTVPSMEIHVHSQLFLAPYKCCTNARCILSRSYVHEEFGNTNIFSVQKAHKAVRAGKYLLSLQRRRVPSMEIYVHSRLFLARYKGCTNARCILSRSYGHEEFENVNIFSVQKAHKAERAGQYLRPMQRRIVPSMEIRAYSRPILARYKGCTNARCMLSRSYGHEEFKNVNPFSVQKAHKSVRAGQYLRPMQRRIVPSMEIRVHSRPILARYKGCINARCMLSRSYGHEEFKNVNPFTVQKAHKSVRAGQYLRPMQRRIVHSMEIRVHSRLILARYKGFTNARCILSRSYGHEEYKNVNPFSVQKAHKAQRASQYLRSLQRRRVPSMEIHVHSQLFLVRYKCCTNARCILSRSYVHEEFGNVIIVSVQKAHKAVRSGQYLHPMQRRIVPSMESRVHSRQILARYKGCINARWILSRSYGHEEFKNVNPFSV